MAEASAVVLDGATIRTDVEIFRYPGRYEEESGTPMWELVNKLADIFNAEAA